MCVVSRDTWPSQARIVLMSTPARSRWTAVVCRIVCGLMRFVAIDGTVLLARSAYCVTSRWIPNRVNGWLLRFKKTASLLPRLATSRDSDVAVTGREHHVAILPPLALLHTDDHAPALDRGGFEVNCFGNPKAGRIADGQDHPMLLASHRVQELGHFLLAQHVGQFLWPPTGHNGQVRNLFPLPCSRTDDCAPSCRLSMVSLAASSARAPLLYKNRSRAWSRSPRGARRSGWARRASISTFSRYPISVLAVFLNGVARISAHQATCVGERMPMNRANDRMVASLWLRVTPLHWRSRSRWSRNLRTIDGVRSSMVMRSMARPPCLLANGSKSARVSR